MRFATIVEGGQTRAAVVANSGVFPIELPFHRRPTTRDLAAFGTSDLRAVRDWADRRAPGMIRPLADVELGPAVMDPGAIYTIGRNYGRIDDRPERPLVYGKLPTSVGAHRAVLTWDRTLTANVDAECEVGVITGRDASIFGYTIVNDVSSRDPWLDG